MQAAISKSTPRLIRIIAEDIETNWPGVSLNARPYLNAMHLRDFIWENYYLDSMESVVLYFLSNSASWRGEAARRIKQELKDILKNHTY